MRTITLSEYEGGMWLVVCDGLVIDRLTRDETLWAVACALMSKAAPWGGFQSIEDLQRLAVKRGWPKPEEEEVK